MNLERLRRKAAQSTCRYKVAAMAFDKKGEYLGICSNRYRFSRKGGGIHAEMALIARYGARIKYMILARINKTGDLCHMDPCEVCKGVCAKMDIKVKSI